MLQGYKSMGVVCFSLSLVLYYMQLLKVSQNFSLLVFLLNRATESLGNDLVWLSFQLSDCRVAINRNSYIIAEELLNRHASLSHSV